MASLGTRLEMEIFEDMAQDSAFFPHEKTWTPRIRTDRPIVASIVFTFGTGKSANQKDGYGQESGQWNFEPVRQQL